MKVLSTRKANGAMTLLEVLVVIATLVVVFAYLVPRQHPPRPVSVVCMSHLRQIDFAFLMYADENKGDLPMQVSTNDNGTMEYLSCNETFPHYQKLAPYFYTMNVLLCPAEKERQAASDFRHLADTNLSYFLNADVSTNSPSTSILAGDRSLKANGHVVSPGLFTLTTNLDMSWSDELHPASGLLAFGDGHVEFCRAANLNSDVRRQKVAVNRLSVP